jgi:hypothetical protein
MTEASKFVGKALYLEFRKGVNTAQIILTPEGITPAGDFVPAGTWRRQISTWSPKKPWKSYAFGDEKFLAERKDFISTNKALPVVLDREEAVNQAEELLGGVAVILNQLHANDWSLYEKPIVLDFSQEDLLNTKEWETPSALIRRILRARKELGFADELLEEPAE